jgi:thiamine-monophosphate kinase
MRDVNQAVGRRLSEADLVEAIRRVAASSEPDVRVGIGDDAAVVSCGDRLQVLTTDMLVEDVDFDLTTTSARDLGYKSVAVNLSDVAAMGATPRFCLVAAGLPADSDPGWVVELFAGMRESADEHAVAIVGGDLSRSDAVVLSVAMTGEAPPGGVVLRTGGRSGDRLVVTGRLGAAAGGLRLLGAGARVVARASAAGWGRGLVGALQRPVARVGEGQLLRACGATAMIDVSDGLAMDLGRLSAASGLGAAVRRDDVPVEPALAELRDVTGDDPFRLALHGGEDFELLAAMPAGAVREAAAALAERFGTPLTEVGELRASPELVLVSSDGSETALEPEGFDHFG